MFLDAIMPSKTIDQTRNSPSFHFLTFGPSTWRSHSPVLNLESAHILIVAKHYFRYPTAVSAKHGTSHVDTKYMKSELIQVFAPHGSNILDSATSFIAAAVLDTMRKYSASWKPVLACAPMVHGHLHLMIGTVKRFVVKMKTFKGWGKNWRYISFLWVKNKKWSHGCLIFSAHIWSGPEIGQLKKNGWVRMRMTPGAWSNCYFSSLTASRAPIQSLPSTIEENEMTFTVNIDSLVRLRKRPSVQLETK